MQSGDIVLLRQPTDPSRPATRYVVDTILKF